METITDPPGPHGIGDPLSLFSSTNSSQINVVLVDEVESLIAVSADKPGYFYGQFENKTLALKTMSSELEKTYSTLSKPPLLYADVQPHLEDYGILWDKDQKFYRVRVTQEFVHEVNVHFVDYGKSKRVPRSKILAPVTTLTRFHDPPFGIRCKLEDAGPKPLLHQEWYALILERSIRVKIGAVLKDGAYSVSLTSDDCNAPVVQSLSRLTIIAANKRTLFPQNVPPESTGTIPKKDMSDEASNRNSDSQVETKTDPPGPHKMGDPSPLLSSTNNSQIDLVLVGEVESLIAVSTDKPGYFYGQFENKTSANLKTMANELEKIYSTLSKPPLLYADVQPHLDDYGIFRDKNHKFFRVRITKELLHKAKVYFIDYGRSQQIPRSEILSPVKSLTRFRDPPFGIRCKLDAGAQPLGLQQEWNGLISKRHIKVKIGEILEDGAYSVSLTSDDCNAPIVKALSRLTTIADKKTLSPQNQAVTSTGTIPKKKKSKETSKRNSDSQVEAEKKTVVDDIGNINTVWIFEKDLDSLWK